MQRVTQIILIISNALLLLLLIEAVRRILRYRSRLRELEGRFDSPIPAVKLDEFHELFAQNGLGLKLEGEVSFIGGGVWGGTSHIESWVLSVLAKQATCLFEFGTGTGRTTYLWAKNSTLDARVITLALSKNSTRIIRQRKKITVRRLEQRWLNRFLTSLSIRGRRLNTKLRSYAATVNYSTKHLT